MQVRVIAAGILFAFVACSAANQPAATSGCVAGREPYVLSMSSGAIMNVPFRGRVVSVQVDGRRVPRPAVTFQREQSWHPDPAKRVVTEDFTTDPSGLFAHRVSPAFDERRICENGRVRTITVVEKFTFRITAAGCAETKVVVDDKWQERDIELECTN